MGGRSEVLPLQKGGRKSFSHAGSGEGGGGGVQNKFEIVLTRELEVLAILMWGWGGAKSFHPLKGGREKFYPVLGGGGGSAKRFGPAISP